MFIDLARRGLLIAYRKKKRKPRTTDSRHGLPTYPNQAKSYIPTQANRLWVSDITYMHCA